MIISASPFDIGGDFSSVQDTIALYNYQQPKPSWEVLVDGRRMEPPCEARAEQRIAIRDGVTYIGIIPLPATDLGRDAEVILHEGDEQTYYGNYKAKAALVIDNYNLRSDTPVKNLNRQALDRACGGFIVEFGDQAQYKTFEEFRRRLDAATLETSFDENRSLHEITYVSGNDKLEMGAFTTWRENQKMNELFAYQRINGKDAYLPAGVERDSPFSVQARTGQLEKNGAVLRCDAGQLGFLQHEPTSGTIGAYNPLAEPNHFLLRTPKGVEITADGKVGLCLLTFEPETNTITLDHAFIEEQDRNPEAAKAFVIFGVTETPAVIRNGRKLEQKLPQVQIGGRKAFVLSLSADDAADVLEGLGARYAAVEERLR